MPPLLRRPRFGASRQQARGWRPPSSRLAGSCPCRPDPNLSARPRRYGSRTLALAAHLLTISRPDASNLLAMFRIALAALIVLSAFSITLVLVTPDPTDDVAAIVRPRILPKASPQTEALRKPFVSLVQASNRQAVTFQLPGTTRLTSRLNPSELADLLCAYRC